MTPPRAPTLRLPLFTLTGLLMAGLLWWLQSSQPSQPAETGQAPADWPWLNEQLLEPVRSNRLNLASLREQVAGSLWLEGHGESARLLYRAEFSRALPWRLQARLQADTADLQALDEALGSEALRQLDTAQTLQLAEHAIAELWLAPQQPLSAADWRAAAGEPRLRLPLESRDAWVYPPLGLTAHLADKQVELIHQLPAAAMRQPGH